MTFAQFKAKLGPASLKLSDAKLLAAWQVAHRREVAAAQQAAVSRARAGAGAGAPSAPAPPGLPTSIGRQDAITDYDQQIGNLPALFNPQRRALAANTAAGLAQTGLYDDVRTEEVGAGDGSLAFRLHGTGEGRAFTQGIGNLAGQAAERGSLNSSAYENARADTARGLFDQRENAMRQFGQAQEQITGGQGQALQQLISGRLGARQDYTEWQAAQPVAPAPPQAPNPNNAGAQAPRPPTAPGVSRLTFAQFRSRLGPKHANLDPAVLAKAWQRATGR